MASNDSTVSLLFKLVADSSQARGDFTSFQNFLKSGVGSLRNIFSDFASGNPAGAISQLKDEAIGLLPSLKGVGGEAAVASGELGGMAATGGVLAGGLAALAVVAIGAAAGIAALAQHAADADEKVFDLTQTTNFSAQSLAAMQLAADTSGTTIQKVSSFISQFEEKLADAAAGNEELGAAFKQFGINAEEGLRNPQAAFDQFLQKFNQLNDDAAKVQLLKKIGGSAELIQFLKEGENGIQGFLDKAKELGIVLPDLFAVQDADRFNDSLTDIRSQFDNLFVTVGRQLVPVLLPLLEKVSDKLSEMGPEAQSFGETLASGTQEGIDTVSALFDLVGEVFNGVRDLIEMVEGGGDTAVQSIQEVNDSFGPIREFLVSTTQEIAFLEDVVRLAADLILGTIKAIALGLVSIPQAFLSLFGIVSETIDAEAKRLGDDFAALNADFDLGLRRTREIARTIAEARGQAAALAGGFAETEIGPDGRIRPKGTANVRPFTSSTTTGGTSAKPVGGKSGKDEREAEARAELKLLELAEKQKELIFKAETDAVKLNLAQQLISHQTATEQLIRIEQVRLAARLEFLAEERRQVEASDLKTRDKRVKIAELDLKADEERQRSQQTVSQIREQQRKRDEQAEEDHRKRLLDLALAADRQEIDRVRELANQRIVSGVNAEKRIAEIEQQSFERRRAALEAQKQTVGPDANDYQKLLDEIAQLESERAAAVEQATARIRAAREREIADQRAFQQALTQAERDLVAKQIELEAQRIDAAERRATTPTERTAIINARAANERNAENLRHEQNLESLRQQEDELQDQATTYDEVLRVTELFNQEFEQEQQRHVQALKELQQELSEAQAAQDPTSNKSLFGIDDQSAGVFEAFSQSAMGALANLASGGLTVKGVLLDVFSGVARAAQSTLSAFILTGKAGGQAFKQLAADIIASLAIESAIQAIFETAKGFAAAAANMPKEAALHFTAAKIYGVVAGAAFAVGAAIGAAGGLGGGGNESQAQGAGAFGGQQRNPEDARFRFGDVTGRLGQDADSQTRGIFGTMFTELRAEIAAQREATDRLAGAASRQAEVGARQAEAAESLVTRINSIPPEDTLAVAVERAPALIGRGLDAATSADSDVTRNLALRLGLA